MKRLLAISAALALLAGITVAAAQSPDGRPADEKNAKSQSQERGPTGMTGASTSNPTMSRRHRMSKKHHMSKHHMSKHHMKHHRKMSRSRMMMNSKDGRPADERTPKAQGEERNPNGTTGGSQTMPSR